MGNNRTNGDVASAFICGIVLTVVIGFLLVIGSALNTEDKARIDACVSAGHDRVVDRGSTQQVYTVNKQTYLICSDSVNVNGTKTVKETAILYGKAEN